MKTLIQTLKEVKSKFASDEVKIEEDLTKFWVTFIWQNGWETISRHRFRKDAEEIKELILKNKTPLEIKNVIDKQNKTRFSKWVAPYWVNW
jgi:16S rRNA C1402 (ribose-2'-O) methylase RsmI